MGDFCITKDFEGSAVSSDTTIIEVARGQMPSEWMTQVKEQVIILEGGPGKLGPPGLATAEAISS